MIAQISRGLTVAAIAAAAIVLAGPASAFCGFYVARADTRLFNEASKVVLARDGTRTVLTMVNDYQGDPSEFAMVIPVPTVLAKEQINIGDAAVVDHLDAYTAPRLVEYHDPNPCDVRLDELEMSMMARSTAPQAEGMGGRLGAAALGVTIEAEYTVGEYDIVILSAEQSDGLAIWLNQEGYRIPDGAEDVLASYLAQDLKFFVAKVNLEEQARAGATFLRPIQVAYESEKFMLPIRLGTVNARGDQELFLFTLTRTGRVETANYRTVKMPTGMDIPIFVEQEFGDFYRATFGQLAERNPGTAILEYAWDMAWCDPCAADPVPNDQLIGLGAFWLTDRAGEAGNQRRPQPGFAPVPTQGTNVFVTRMHLRYNSETHPEDLMLTETGDRENFQARYVLRHPYLGEANCEAVNSYRATLPERFRQEAGTLATLTGWDQDEIVSKMAANGQPIDVAPLPATDGSWWDRMWGTNR